MAQNVNPTFVKTPNFGSVQITTGTGSSTLVTVYTGGVNGSKISSLIATALGTTAAFDVQWGVTNGSTFLLIGTVSVSAGAGSTDSVNTVNMMNTTSVAGLPIDSDGNPFFFLASSAWSVQTKAPATSSTWAAGALVTVTAPAVGDF